MSLTSVEVWTSSEMVYVREAGPVRVAVAMPRRGSTSRPLVPLQVPRIPAAGVNTGIYALL